MVLLSLLLCGTRLSAQEKSDLQQRAEVEAAAGKMISARSLWIRAFEDYVNKGQTAQGVECGVKAAAVYHGESSFQEAFDLLRNIDHAISADKDQDAKRVAAWRYKVAHERMVMYIKMRRSERAQEQIDIMERHAAAAADEALKNDLLYNKAIFYYTFGQEAKGNAIFKEMANKLTASKEYGKVDEVYQTLIANGRKSGNANMVAQAYSGYIAWKDSASALKLADTTHALQQQIDDGLNSISEKDSALAARQRVIIGLCILAAVLAAVLVLTLLLLLRLIHVIRKQKKNIRLANENNALKARFISNISAQLSPTLQKLDAQRPEVRALVDFSNHIQMLSQLESTMGETVELEDTQLPPFCEGLVDQIRDTVRKGVAVYVDAPKMSASINREYVSHILLHLLHNAASFTPEDGHIRLEYKKRSAHKHQFLVSNTGEKIPEEKREDVFKPFLEVRDLTMGDGLGLPICKQMAVKMNGDLDIDPEFTKGTRFVLTLQV